MKVILNFIGLCFFLLVGGQHLHADTNSIAFSDFPSFNFVKKEQVKVKTEEPGSVLIEEVGVDLDEEFHSKEDLNNGNANKFLAVKNGMMENWYLTFSSSFLFKDCSKNNIILTPNCGYSSPIYLRIGVLRI